MPLRCSQKQRRFFSVMVLSASCLLLWCVSSGLRMDDFRDVWSDGGVDEVDSKHRVLPSAPDINLEECQVTKSFLSVGDVGLTPYDFSAAALLGGDSWGYASERNEARWKLISKSLAERFPTKWVLPAERSNDAPPPPLEAVDLGADQGYFSLSALRLLQTLQRLGTAGWASRHQCGKKPVAQPLKPQRTLTTEVYAVEKGGFGGSFWKAASFSKSNSTVLDVIREKYKAHSRKSHGAGDNSTSTATYFHICPTTIDLSLLRAALPRGQRLEDGSLRNITAPPTSLLFALSMLHWVAGVDGEQGFADTMCLLGASADVVFVELPHPAARRTFGESRYRKWYRREKNVTKLIAKALTSCDRMYHPPECTLSVSVAGRTAWGGHLYREIHRIDRLCTGSTSSHTISYLHRLSTPLICQLID